MTRRPQHGVLVFNGIVIDGLLAAIAKPLLEWTKVAAAGERPVGVFFWWFADTLSALLSRTILPPPDKVPDKASSASDESPSRLSCSNPILDFLMLSWLDHPVLIDLGTLVLRNWYRPIAEAEDPQGPVGAAIALCFLASKRAFEQVGGFDENLFILYEDNEFSYKLRMRGHLIRLCPDAICTHKAGTAGLSVRGEASYPGKRTYLHSKNRWYVLFTCMRWRTLLLTAPAQLVYGVVYAGFGLRSGHLGSWLKGKWALLTLLPRAFAARGPAQRGRTVPDRDLLVAAPMTLNPGLADKGAGAALRRGMDRFFSVYWRLVRGLCG